MFTYIILSRSLINPQVYMQMRSTSDMEAMFQLEHFNSKITSVSTWVSKVAQIHQSGHNIKPRKTSSNHFLQRKERIIQLQNESWNFVLHLSLLCWAELGVQQRCRKWKWFRKWGSEEVLCSVGTTLSSWWTMYKRTFLLWQEQRTIGQD